MDLFGVPLEVVSLVAGGIGGFYMKNKAMNQKYLHEERMAARESRAEARQDGNGVWVRRFIVLVFMGLLGFIVVGPAFLDVNTVMVSDGWFGMHTTEIKGIMYDQSFRMILTTIIGYYFGDSTASVK